MVKKAQLIKYKSNNILLEYIHNGMVSYEQVPYEMQTRKIKEMAEVAGGTTVLVYKSRNKYRKIKKYKKRRAITTKQIDDSFALLDAKFPSKK